MVRVIVKVLLPCWLAFFASPQVSDAAVRTSSPAATKRHRIAVLGEAYEPGRTSELVRLVDELGRKLGRERERLEDWRHRRELLLAGRPLAGLSQDELKAYFHPPEDLLRPRELRGLEQIRIRATWLLRGSGSRLDQHLLEEMAELAAALQNARRDPVPRMDMFSVPFLAFDFLDNSIGGGGREAVNVPAPAGVDSGETHPPESIFWTGDRPIERQDLFAGFGRESLPDWAAQVWEYAGPKLSAGSTPGFEIRHGRWQAKLKFRETKSEPLTARLFHALGYHVDSTDHVRGLRVRYDPRLFREFNLRREVMMHFRLIGPPVVSLNLQEHCDPLDFLEAAVLRDGTRLSAGELRDRVRPSDADPTTVSWVFDPGFELQIDHLILAPVNFQIESADWKSVGRWDYGQLGHQDLRELRGAGLLAAWLGWFDARFDNTSLRVRTDGDRAGGLRACFSDLGAGFGKSDRGFGWLSENANEFPWEFTRAPIDRGPGRMRTPFRVVRFHTIASNPAFEAMTEADARWMARRIARLSAAQLTGALIASGHDAAETTLYLAKLISRRDKLLQDLGLQDELQLLGERTGPRALDYDPQTDGLPEVRFGTAVYRPPAGDHVVVNGRLVSRPSMPPRTLAVDE